MKRVGVDVGGTFTDLIEVDDETGTILVHKLPTTPDDPSKGTVQGIREIAAEAGIEPSDLDQVFHGTTIATNIVIEHNGAKVGMLTTEGYRDILHIARHKKPLNFSNYQDLPWQRYPIVRRRYRRTVPERITRDGEVLVPLDEERARERVRELKEAGVEAVAVCFLFSFLNPDHEARVAAIVREEFPEAFLSVSSEVLPQYREYERFSTVCLNAFIGPKVASYVRRLEDELQGMGVRTGVHLMTSASGVATAEGAVARPVNLLMSGPVAGVVGGIWAGRQAGYDSVITLDVGGTSADIGLAQDGRLRMKHLLDTRVGPYQAMIPMVDVDTIGAGGGSIAYVDQGGIFRVGPRSAGADPGPAAYDRGGTEATATDAMVNLGWLVPEAFLGGGMTLRPDLARKAFEDGPATRARHVGRGGVDGRRADPDALDGAVDRGELGPQGLRPARLRPRGRGRRRAAVLGAGRRRGRDALGARTALPGDHLGDGPARHGHGVRVRLDRVPAPLDARRRSSRAAVRRARRACSRAARGGRRACRSGSRPARRRLPVSRTGVRAPGRRSVRARSTTTGSRGYGPTSTTSTSASTRGGSRSRTSRSRTSASAGSA